MKTFAPSTQHNRAIGRHQRNTEPRDKEGLRLQEMMARARISNTSGGSGSRGPGSGLSTAAWLTLGLLATSVVIPPASGSPIPPPSSGRGHTESGANGSASNSNGAPQNSTLQESAIRKLRPGFAVTAEQAPRPLPFVQALSDYREAASAAPLRSKRDTPPCKPIKDMTHAEISSKYEVFGAMIDSLKSGVREVMGQSITDVPIEDCPASDGAIKQADKQDKVHSSSASTRPKTGSQHVPVNLPSMGDPANSENRNKQEAKNPLSSSSTPQQGKYAKALASCNTVPSYRCAQDMIAAAQDQGDQEGAVSAKSYLNTHKQALIKKVRQEKATLQNNEKYFKANPQERNQFTSKEREKEAKVKVKASLNFLRALRTSEASSEPAGSGKIKFAPPKENTTPMAPPTPESTSNPISSADLDTGNGDQETNSWGGAVVEVLEEVVGEALEYFQAKKNEDEGAG